MDALPTKEAVAGLAALVLAGDEDADRLLTLHAAHGSLEAQRALLDIIVHPACSLPALGGAEMLARLAYQLGDASDGRRLASILWTIAMEWRALHVTDQAHAKAVECFAILRDLADAGDSCANACIAEFGAEFPEAMAEAGLGASPVPVPDYAPLVLPPSILAPVRAAEPSADLPDVFTPADLDWASTWYARAGPMIAAHYGFRQEEVWDAISRIESRIAGESPGPFFGRMFQAQLGVSSLGISVAMEITGLEPSAIPSPLRLPTMH